MEPVDDADKPLGVRLESLFTSAELERLEAYRAAVRHGFFNDA
jgi:hypothetical protein